MPIMVNDGMRKCQNCGKCPSCRAAEWNKTHPERRKEIANRYARAHKQDQSEYKREYRQRPEVKKRERKYKKAYRKAHPETTTRVWHKRWRERHPDLVKAIKRRTAQRRWARMKGAIGDATKQQLDARWLLWAGLCWMCGKAANEWDHVKPLARGGAHLPCNLRPACGTCNRVKQDKWPFEAGTCR